MKKISFAILLILVTAGCSRRPSGAVPDTPTATQKPLVTHTTDFVEPSPTLETPMPAVAAQPAKTDTPVVETTIDLSGVTLYEATFLMDPNFFQVSLDSWPELLLEDVVVAVDGETYTCEELFPEDFPNRIYCFGPAPRKGDQVSVLVTLQGSSEPLLEIPFVVPAPGGGGGG